MPHLSLSGLPRRLKRFPERLKGIPTPSLLIILLLVVVNAVVWVAVGIVLHFFPYLVTPAVLAYTLGLRHALDADHIAAIDLMTRRLIAAGQRPVSVGTFFSLGHSTIVVATCLVVAATSGALRERFDDFQHVGGIIGTSVSAVVLLLLCAGNGWVMWRLVRSLKAALARQRIAAQMARPGVVANAPAPVSHPTDAREALVSAEAGVGESGPVPVAGHLDFEGGGFLARVFWKVFRIVDRPWKMFPIGVLFGLGFDTSSEVALLALASLQGAQGTSIWLILIFPVLFTCEFLPFCLFNLDAPFPPLCTTLSDRTKAGMCLLDTTDGALMMALYTSKVFARDTVAIVYYSIVLTGITVLVAASIGIIQVLSLVQNIADPPGAFWDGVAVIGDNFDIIGGSICGLFLLLGLVSVLLYRPWRRRMERNVHVAANSLQEASPVEENLIGAV